MGRALYRIVRPVPVLLSLLCALAALACSSKEFETKPASNDDAGTGGSSGGSGGAGGTASGGAFPGGTGGTGGSVVSCDLDAGALDTEGCACSLEGEAKACYLGTPGPASACTPGNQSCTSGKWGPCVGAGAPAEELCGDGIDNDCDGKTDEGCVCTSGYDLCEDEKGTQLPSGDNVFVDKQIVGIGDTLHVYVVSTSPLGEVAHSMSDSQTPFYCGGQTGVNDCEVGDGCNGWYGAVVAIPVNSPPFHAGEDNEITLYLGDSGPPCDVPRTKKVTVQVQ
jgi:hypothetical protein